MKIKREFVLREIAGDILLVPAGKTALDLNGMITLNAVGADIWKMLPEDCLGRNSLALRAAAQTVLQCAGQRLFCRLGCDPKGDRGDPSSGSLRYLYLSPCLPCLRGEMLL